MAENAAKDGRLDEAHEFVTADDLRDHRRAQQVLCGLVEPYLERARRRAADRQYAEALADLGKAADAGTRLEEITALRDQVLSTMKRVQQGERHRRATLEQARDKIRAASIAGGNRLLDGVENDTEVQRLRSEAAEREAAAQRAIEETERLLDAGRLPAAAEALHKAKSLFPRTPGLAELEAAVGDACFASVRSRLESGALHRAADELAAFGTIGETLPARRELEQILSLATHAATAVTQRRTPDAVTALRKLSHLLGGCDWVTCALRHLVDAQAHLDEVVGGPLGSVNLNGHPKAIAAPPPAAVPPPVGDAPGPDDKTVVTGDLPSRLLVCVDDGGAYLLARGSRVSIGRAGAGSSADVALFADLHEHHAEIVRVGEDYFLFAKHPVKVGDETVTQKLLQDGDRIRFGRRARITFRQPSRMSASAVLDLGDGVRSYHDVRRVVLFDGHALVGRHRHCHIAARGGELILFERSGRLWLQEAADGKGLVRSRNGARAVPLDQYVSEAGVGLSVRPWRQN